MAISTTQNLVPTKVEYDNAILSALCLPALIFNLSTLKVIESNDFFCNEHDVLLNHLLIKYNYNFLKLKDIQNIVQCLNNGEKYSESRISDSNNKIKTFQVNVSALPDNQNAFLYLNLLSDLKFSDPGNLSAKKAAEKSVINELVANVQEGIAIINEDFAISFYNQSF